MKKIMIVSPNKVLAQGLMSTVQNRPGLNFEWLAQLGYSEAAIGVDVYHADVVILDVMDEVVADEVLELCRTLRKGNSGICLLLLVRQDQSNVRTMAVKAKQAGIADDFVFYDSSLAYLFAKLAAL